MPDQATTASMEAMRAAAKLRKAEFGGHLLALEAMARDAGHAGWPAYRRAAEEHERMTTSAKTNLPSILETCAAALMRVAQHLPDDVSGVDWRLRWDRLGGGVINTDGMRRLTGEGSMSFGEHHANRRWDGDEGLSEALRAVADAPAFAQGPDDHDFYGFGLMARRWGGPGSEPMGHVHIRQQGGVYWDTLARADGSVVHAMYAAGVPIPEDAVARGDWAAVHAVARQQRDHEVARRPKGGLRFDPLDWGFAFAGMVLAERIASGVDPVLSFRPAPRVVDAGEAAVARLMAG